MEALSNIIREIYDHADVDVLTIEGKSFAVTNGKQQLHDLEPILAPLRDKPRLIAQDIDVRTPKSLAAYMNLYADTSHMALVSTAAPFTVCVILDYHIADPELEEGNQPRWGSHTITMKPRYTPAYAAWRERHRKQLGQRDTMEFLEDRMVDVVKPDAADVMDMVMNFDGLTKVTFSSSQRLTDGRVQVVYKEEEADSGRVTFYEELTLMLPVFEGAEPEPVKVRVRHRTRDGQLSFIFVIANIEELERAAFERLCDVWRVDFTSVPLREISV